MRRCLETGLAERVRAAPERVRLFSKTFSICPICFSQLCRCLFRRCLRYDTRRDATSKKYRALHENCPNRGAGSRKGHIARALVGHSIPRLRRWDQGNSRAYTSIPRRNENRIEWFRYFCDVSIRMPKEARSTDCEPHQA